MAGSGTAADIADWLGISERRVRELQASETIPKGDTKAAVRAYCAHIRPAAGRSASGGSDGAAAVDMARVRILTAQADAREMLNSQMRGEIMTAGDVEAVAGAIVDGVRAKILALPTRAAPLLIGISGPGEVRQILTGLVHDALIELAACDVVSRIADRTRGRAGRGLDVDPNTPPAGTAP